jgi:hypothetical protein
MPTASSSQSPHACHSQWEALAAAAPRPASCEASRRRVWRKGQKVGASFVPGSGSKAACIPCIMCVLLPSAPASQHHARALANWPSRALASPWHFPPINETRRRRRGRAHLRRIPIIPQQLHCPSHPAATALCPCLLRADQRGRSGSIPRMSATLTACLTTAALPLPLPQPTTNSEQHATCAEPGTLNQTCAGYGA